MTKLYITQGPTEGALNFIRLHPGVDLEEAIQHLVDKLKRDPLKEGIVLDLYDISIGGGARIAWSLRNPELYSAPKFKDVVHLYRSGIPLRPPKLRAVE